MIHKKSLSMISVNRYVSTNLRGKLYKITWYKHEEYQFTDVCLHKLNTK